MNDWNPRANEIFAEVASVADETARLKLLDKQCGANGALRRAVESLLLAYEEAPSFLDEALVQPENTSASLPQETIGSQIGQFRLLQKIGEGGFGIVYMAEQEEPVRRKVALKVIKAGMDTHEVIARFEAERQALAMMDHPCIAKVFDGGTTASGRPYFAMELVHGVTITEFCDDNQANLRERLELFSDVCRAVQHAHQKGIIHRDLKPSNIMVTLSNGAPLVKVIDFGVAKAINQKLTEKTLFTSYGQMVGTPQYMSPEQAGMSAIDLDTRSDIYSLGILLYELLTGTPPLDAKRLRESAFEEVRRIIREEEPPTPSLRLRTLGRQLNSVATNRKTDPLRLRKDVTGDLDWIVMKCLEKDQRRRYSTANDLESDVNRHLDGLVVEACPPTFRYRMSKLVRRHRLAFVVGSLITSLLLVSSVAAWYLLALSNAAKNKEKLARQDAEMAKREAVEQRTIAENSLAQLQNRTQQLDITSDKLSQQVYLGNFARAANAYKDGDHLATRNFLDLCRDEGQQSWEWQFLSNAIDPDLAITLDGPPVHHMTPSPVVGRIAVIVGLDEQFRLVIYDLDTTSGEARELWAQDLDIVVPYKPVFSSDGSLLAVGSFGNLPPEKGNGGLQVFDVESGQRIWAEKMEQFHAVGTMTFLPDTSTMVYSKFRFHPFENMEGQIHCRDIRQQKEKWNVTCGGFPFLTVSPDQKHLYASIATAPIRSWNTRVECRSVSDGGKLWEATRPSFSFAVPDPAGLHLLIGAEGHFELRNLAKPEQAARSFADVGFVNATYSPAGDHVLLVNSDNVFSVRRLPDYSEVLRWRAFSDNVAYWNGDAHWTWDGKSIMYTSGASNRIEFRRAIPPQRVQFQPAKDQPASCYCYSPDGEQIYGLGPAGSLTVWDTSTGQERRQQNVGPYSNVVTVSRDGKFVAVGGNEGLKLLKTDSFEELQEFACPGTSSIAFSPDCRTIAFGGIMQREIEAWDIKTGKRMAQYKAVSNNGDLLFLDDEHLVAACNGSRQLVFLNVKTGAATLAGDREMTNCGSMAFSPQQKLIAAGLDDRVEIWDIKDPASIKHTKLTGHRVFVMKVAFHPTEPRLFSLDEVGRIRVWDTRTLKEIMTLPSVEDASVSPQRSFDLDFSLDGNTLVSRWGMNGHRVFESTKPSVEVDEKRRLARKAAQKVNELFASGTAKEAMERLNADSGLDPQIREVATQIAGGRISPN